MKALINEMSLVERVSLCIGILLFILTGSIALFEIAFNDVAFDMLLITAGIMIIASTIPRMLLGRR